MPNADSADPTLSTAKARTDSWGDWILHVSAALLLACSGVQACWLRATLPKEPMLWPDLFYYLFSGINMDASGIWTASMRKFLYPAFVYGTTHIAGSSAAIATVQHAAGLVAGAVLFIAWLVIIRPLWPRRQRHGFYCLLGVLLAHVYWTSPVVLFYECYVMPESLFLSLSSIEILLLVWAIRSITINQPGGARGNFVLPLASLTVVGVGLYFQVPRFGFAMGLVPVAVGGLALLWGHPWRRVVLALALAGVVATMTFAVPERLLSRHEVENASYFVELHLFGMHVHLIRDELEAESQQPSPRYDRSFLLACRDSIDREMARSKAGPPNNQPYPTLGFSPEEIIYGDSTVMIVTRYFKNDADAIRRFFSHFYFAVWQHRPGAMMHKIGTELFTYYYAEPSHAFTLNPANYSVKEMIGTSSNLGTVEGGRGLLDRSIYWKGYAQRLQTDHYREAITFQPIGWRVERLATQLLLPLTLLVAVGAIARVPWRRRHLDDLPASTILLAGGMLLLPALGGNLTVALLHSLYPSRYLDTLYTFSLAGIAVGLLSVPAILIPPIRRILRGGRAAP